MNRVLHPRADVDGGQASMLSAANNDNANNTTFSITSADRIDMKIDDAAVSDLRAAPEKVKG